MLKRLILGAWLSLAVYATLPATARADDTGELIAADAARSAAMVAADVVALEAMLGDELTYVHSTGALDSKPRLIESLATHEVRYRSISSRDVQARLYATNGVIVGVAAFEVEKGGNSRSLTLRYTAHYVRRAGRWQLIAYQSTVLPAATP